MQSAHLALLLLLLEFCLEHLDVLHEEVLLGLVERAFGRRRAGLQSRRVVQLDLLVGLVLLSLGSIEHALGGFSTHCTARVFPESRDGTLLAEHVFTHTLHCHS